MFQIGAATGATYFLDINDGGSITGFYYGDNGELIQGAVFCASQGKVI